MARSRFADQGLSGGVDVSRPHGEDEVARPGQLPQGRRHLRQGGAVAGPWDPGRQILGGDADVIGLPGGIDLCQQGHVRLLEHLYKVIEERRRAGVGVGLEGADYPLIAQSVRGIQQRLQLAWVMGVVVIDLRAANAPLLLEAAPRPAEVPQSALHRLSGHPQGGGGGGGGQGVLYIMEPGHPQGDMGKPLPPQDDVKAGQPL